MGTITISLNDEVEKIFRKRTSQLYGTGKGSLSKALAEAVLEWSRRKGSLDKCLKLLNDGVDMGRLSYKKREELHDRN